MSGCDTFSGRGGVGAVFRATALDCGGIDRQNIFCKPAAPPPLATRHPASERQTPPHVRAHAAASLPPSHSTTHNVAPPGCLRLIHKLQLTSVWSVGSVGSAARPDRARAISLDGPRAPRLVVYVVPLVRQLSARNRTPNASAQRASSASSARRESARDRETVGIWAGLRAAGGAGTRGRRCPRVRRGARALLAGGRGARTIVLEVFVDG